MVAAGLVHVFHQCTYCQIIIQDCTITPGQQHYAIVSSVVFSEDRWISLRLQCFGSSPVESGRLPPTLR